MLPVGLITPYGRAIGSRLALKQLGSVNGNHNDWPLSLPSIITTLPTIHHQLGACPIRLPPTAGFFFNDAMKPIETWQNACIANRPVVFFGEKLFQVVKIGAFLAAA